ncbi:MAG TPA: hypothetical protein DDX85_03610, partial [Nitrospiraceae bacterium]|nr:hypothetical protein [Nitrospiraceae bacterium]
MKKTNKPSPGYIQNLFEQDLLEAIGDPVSIQDTDFRILYQNSKSKEMTGDHTGEYCYALYGNTSGVCEGCPLRITFREGIVCTTTISHAGKPGLQFEITSSPIGDEGGTIIAGIEVTREISERHRIQDDLRKFKLISDRARDAHFLVDREGRFQYVNEAACRVLGYSEKELLRLSVLDVDVVYDRTKYRELFDLAQRQNIPPVHTQNKRKDGSVFFSEVVVTGYEIYGEPYMFAVLEDISHRKSIEEIMLNISKGVSCQVGEQFFHSLTGHLNKILGADYSYIAELIPEKPSHLRTLSFFADGKNIDNIEVNLSGTPCESVLADNVCTCTSGVQSLFPHARIMAEMKIEGYVGKLLYSSSGKKLG